MRLLRLLADGTPTPPRSNRLCATRHLLKFWTGSWYFRYMILNHLRPSPEIESPEANGWPIEQDEPPSFKGVDEIYYLLGRRSDVAPLYYYSDISGFSVTILRNFSKEDHYFEVDNKIVMVGSITWPPFLDTGGCCTSASYRLDLSKKVLAFKF